MHYFTSFKLLPFKKHFFKALTQFHLDNDPTGKMICRYLYSMKKV